MRVSRQVHGSELLTRRDQRMLYAMASGLTMKEVAAIEEASALRIENRLRKLRERLGARTTVELVAMALALSWIPPAHRKDDLGSPWSLTIANGYRGY
jgi:DNA-binding CsgD family transcriptional regulator